MVKSQTTPKERNRLYSLILMIGSGILLARTLAMISGGGMRYLSFFVGAALIFEFLVDLTCFLGSVLWFIKNNSSFANIPLQTGAFATILHAIRVGIFTIGRTGPWIDFDVKPQFISTHASRWNWAEVYFASVMSVLGIIALIIIYYLYKNTNYLYAEKPKTTFYPLLFIVFFVSSLAISFAYNKSLEKKDVDFESVIATCTSSSDCELPMEYAIRSNCPFSVECVDLACKVVCPLTIHDPDPNISKSYQVGCTKDTDCDCSERGDFSKDCRCVDNKCLSIEDVIGENKL